MRKAIFLDRDGLLVEDKGYMRDVRDVRILPNVKETLNTLSLKGWVLIVVSNQSGVGRGLITEDEHLDVHHCIQQQLLMVHAWFYCTHKPEDECKCRKPRPGMILKAAMEWELDLKRSILIGDKSTDIIAAVCAGCLYSICTSNIAEILDNYFIRGDK